MKKSVRYRWLSGLAFMLLTLAIPFSGMSQGLEDFTNSNATPSYGSDQFLGNDGITWTYVKSRNANGDDNASGIDLPALMLRRQADNSKITSSAIPGGIGNFSVKLYKGFTGGGDRQAELFVNGISQGTSDAFDDNDEHVFEVNNINIAGDVTIEIRDITSKQLIIDDISWTAFVGSGNQPPSITNITQTPADGNVTSSDAVSVSADITDSDGIDAASLNWGTTSGSLNNSIAMTASSGDTYTTDADIGVQPDGTTVYYEIEATDGNASPETTTTPEQSYTVQDPAAAPSLIFSEIADPGDDFNGRFVELYNNGSSSIDFGTTTVYLANFSNGNSTAQSVQLTGTLAAGDFYVIGSNSPGFNESYAFNPDIYSGIANGNGDDAYALYVGGDPDSGDLFDVYGVIGTDGSGEPWEYEDSRAVRNDLSVTPKTTWMASEYTITSADVADMTPGTGEGNQPPQISDITQTPDAVNVTTSDAVSVSAEITADDGIASATLHWATSSGSLDNSITMSLTSGNIYTTNTDIPAQNVDGTTVYYEIQATDDNDAFPQITVSAVQTYTVSSSTQSGAIIITEIMQNPAAVGDADGEYFEVYNNSSSPIDMNGWNISDEGSNSDDINSSLIVPAHGFLTFGVNADPATNGGIVVDYVISGSLANGDDEIIITDAGGNEVNRVEYDGGPVWPNPTGVSMYFAGNVNQDNNDGSLWQVSTESIAIGGDMGSPKFAGEGQIGQANTYTYENGSWSDPISNATADDDIQIISGSTPASFGQDIEVRGIAVVSGASLDVKKVLTINGDIVTNGTMTFKSTSGLDGELAEVPANSKIIGNVTAERYMSDNRAYRFVSSSVSTIGMSTIHDNLQEGATSAMDDPNPGFGTHITGSTTDQENGFDETASGTPSLFVLDASNQQFVPFDNTDVDPIIAGQGILIFVRGDRDVDLTSNASHSSTTLRGTGTLVTGDFTQNMNTSSVQGEFNPVANPYQSSVDVNDVITNSTNLSSHFAFVYDPSFGTNGGYVMVTLPGGANNSDGESDANQYIQPGQAVQVATNSDGPTSILFKESDKATGMHTTTFSNENPFVDNVHINGHLFTAVNYAANKPMHDNFNILFNENFDNALNNRDAGKPMNFTENMGIGTPDQAYSIERRQLPTEDENIALFNTNYENENYTLVLDVSAFDNVNVYLEDSFTGEETELQAGETVYSFSVDANLEGSVASDRFSIHFGNSTLSTDSFNTDAIRIYPNPVKSGQAFNLTTGNLKGQQVNVSIQDVLGKTIYTTKRKFDGKTVHINSGNLQSGVYFVNLDYNGNQVTKRLIVK